MRGERTVGALRRASVRVSIAALALIALLPGAGSATIDGRLARTEDELASIAALLEQQVRRGELLRASVVEADARAGAITETLARLLAERIEVEDAARRAQLRYDEARDELAAIAIEAFMRVPAGTADAFPLTAALGASSLAELGDSVTFASAVGDERALAADAVERARARLAARGGGLEVMSERHRELLDELGSAQQQLADALGAHETALADLDATRDAAVALVARLGARAKAAALGGVGAAFRGEHHVSYGEWAERSLRYLDLPTCRNNRIVVVAWQVQESTTAAWNPLATTRRMPGSTDFNSVGVQHFTSLRQGLEATRGTIENGMTIYRYGAIVEALAACAAPLETAEAIAASSWCPGCLQGLYVVGLVPKVAADYASYAAL